MIYKFKSKATGDHIMLGTPGDQMMRILGRAPAAKGIIEVADMPAALAALEAAIGAEPETKAPAADAEEAVDSEPVVSLQQRLWPMVEMLRTAHAAGVPVIWGV